jgi:hypothetical protein
MVKRCDISAWLTYISVKAHCAAVKRLDNNRTVSPAWLAWVGIPSL